MQEHDPLQPTSDSQREALEEAVETYEVAALVSDEVDQYLADRGITEETARTFRLGLVEDPLPGHDRYRGKLCLPYLHHSGYPLTVRFRCITDHGSGPGKACRDNGHGKYLTMTDDRSRMFNVGTILRAGEEIHVTEGEFDAMLLEGLGYNAVAVAGAQAWKWHYQTLLAGFSRIFVWGDPDDAGADLVQRVGRALPRSRGVRLRDGDVTDTFLEHGADHMAELVEAVR